MRNHSLLPVTTLFLALAALVANHAVPRYQDARSMRVPVETFPRVIGAWKAGPDIPEDPAIRKALPTAHILERNYARSNGPALDVVLLTADRGNDMHNPMICLPDQGWTLTPDTPVRVGADSYHSMTATMGGTKMDLMYCWTAKSVSHHTVSQRLQRFRSRFLGVNGYGIANGTEGYCLFVRLIAPHTADRREMLAFARQIIPLIEPYKQLARRREQD